MAAIIIMIISRMCKHDEGRKTNVHASSKLKKFEEDVMHRFGKIILGLFWFWFFSEKFMDVGDILGNILGFIWLPKIRSNNSPRCRKLYVICSEKSALKCTDRAAVWGWFRCCFGTGKIVQGCQNIPIIVGDVLGQTGVNSDTQKASVLGVEVTSANLSRIAVCGNFRGWNLLDLKSSGADL